MRASRDAEIVGEFSASVGDIVSGVIQQGRDQKMVYVDLGRVEGRIPPHEQVPGEVYTHGERIKCFVVEVKQGTKGPEVMLSRSHPALVKQLFALEVPEIRDQSCRDHGRRQRGWPPKQDCGALSSSGC